MNIDDLLSSIDSEIARLQQARTLLAGTRGGKSAASPPVKRERTLSAAARKRIGDAQRKRWAAAKMAVKTIPAKAAKKAAAPAKKRRLSAAARKRTADAQKERWAAVKAEKAAKPAPAKKVTKKPPAKKPAPAKKAPAKKAPAAKAKKAAPEKATTAPTEAAAS
jgi:hypothetical protein